MPRSNINRLQELLKKTREYKNSVVFSNRLFFNSEAGEVKRDDLIKRYEEVKSLIEEAVGGPPLRYFEGQHLKVFEWAYSDRDLKLAWACIRLAPEFIVKAIAYHSGKKVRPAGTDVTTAVYIQSDIIQQFKDKQLQKKDGFDYTKLIGLLEEINFNYNGQKPYATAVLIKALLNHIPPLLSFGDFKLLANNYKGRETIGKYLKKLDIWRDMPDDVSHLPIDIVSTSIIMDYLPPPFQIDRLLRECLKSKVEPVKQITVQPKNYKINLRDNISLSDKMGPKVKAISEMSWANYAVDHLIWSCFRVVVEIDNFDNNNPDFISTVSLTGKVSGQEWTSKDYYFQNSNSANSPYKIEGHDIKQTAVYISHIDFGNHQRFPMPEFEPGTVILNVNLRSGTKIKIPIQSIKSG